MDLSVNRQITNGMPAFALMLFLYFVIGIFTVINQQLQVPLKSAMLPSDGNLTNALVTLLNFSWFAAYPLSEGFATRWVDRYSYKKTSIYALLILVGGLCLYEVAVLFHMYTPVRFSIFGDRVSVGFFIFLAGSFVIGIAAAVIQVVLNLYLAICPFRSTTSLQRQMFGGTAESGGMSVAPLIVSAWIFGSIPLATVQSHQFVLPVICLMGVAGLLIFMVTKARVPDYEIIVPQNEQVFVKSIWSFTHLKLGVWGIFFYMGVEVCVGANINMYAVQLGGAFATSATAMASVYWTGMLCGLLAASFLHKVSPQKQLRFSSVAAMFIIILSIWLKNPWILAATGFFHSVMWPSIFTLAIKKLGKYTARGSGVLMIGVIGGGVFPVLQGVLADIFDGEWRWTWILVILAEAYILFYGLSGYKIKHLPGGLLRSNETAVPPPRE